jgi:hypothetical protein
VRRRKQAFGQAWIASAAMNSAIACDIFVAPTPFRRPRCQPALPQFGKFARVQTGWGFIWGNRAGDRRMSTLLLIVMLVPFVLFAAVSLYVAILKVRQQAWSEAVIWIFVPLVVFGGLTMAVMGASSAVFLALVLLGGSAAVILIGFKYRQNPVYVDDQGKQQTVAPAWIFVFFGLGGLLFIGGGFVLTHLDMFVSQ